MHTILKFIIVILFVFFWGLVSSSDYEDIKSDYIYYSQIEGDVIDMDNNGVHDSICNCEICLDIE
jgi:hypothetical protein